MQPGGRMSSSSGSRRPVEVSAREIWRALHVGGGRAIVGEGESGS